MNILNPGKPNSKASNFGMKDVPFDVEHPIYIYNTEKKLSSTFEVCNTGLNIESNNILNIIVFQYIKPSSRISAS